MQYCITTNHEEKKDRLISNILNLENTGVTNLIIACGFCSFQTICGSQTIYNLCLNWIHTLIPHIIWVERSKIAPKTCLS